MLTLIAIPLITSAQVQLDPQLKPEFAANVIPPEGANRGAFANIVLQLVAGSLIYAAGPLAVLLIAIGGLRYVTSHGDQTQMEEAKKTITWAVIGLIVIIISWAIVTNVISILNATNVGSGG